MSTIAYSSLTPNQIFDFEYCPSDVSKYDQPSEDMEVYNMERIQKELLKSWGFFPPEIKKLFDLIQKQEEKSKKKVSYYVCRTDDTHLTKFEKLCNVDLICVASNNKYSAKNLLFFLKQIIDKNTYVQYKEMIIDAWNDKIDEENMKEKNEIEIEKDEIETKKNKIEKDEIMGDEIETKKNKIEKDGIRGDEIEPETDDKNRKITFGLLNNYNQFLSTFGLSCKFTKLKQEQDLSCFNVYDLDTIYSEFKQIFNTVPQWIESCMTAMEEINANGGKRDYYFLFDIRYSTRGGLYCIKAKHEQMAKLMLILIVLVDSYEIINKFREIAVLENKISNTANDYDKNMKFILDTNMFFEVFDNIKYTINLSGLGNLYKVYDIQNIREHLKVHSSISYELLDPFFESIQNEEKNNINSDEYKYYICELTDTNSNNLTIAKFIIKAKSEDLAKKVLHFAYITDKQFSIMYMLSCIEQKSENKNKENKLVRKHISEPYFTQILEGDKRVEGRLYKGFWKDLDIGSNFILYTFDEEKDTYSEFEVSVTNFGEYSSFEEMIIFEGLIRVLPRVKSLEEGVKVYRKYFTKEDEKKYTVVGYELEVCNGETADYKYSEAKNKFKLE